MKQYKFTEDELIKYLFVFHKWATTKLTESDKQLITEFVVNDLNNKYCFGI